MYSIYGPNSEIGWNKEGSRGFALLQRSTPQTALTLYADRAAEVGNNSNKQYPLPEETRRAYVIGGNEVKEENIIKTNDSDSVSK